MGVVNAMSADNYGFTPRAATFASEQGTIQTLTTKEDCVAILAKPFAFAHKAIATITVQNAFEPIKPVDGMKTRATLAAFGVAHGDEHYGQMGGVSAHERRCASGQQVKVGRSDLVCLV